MLTAPRRHRGRSVATALLVVLASLVVPVAASVAAAPPLAAQDDPATQGPPDGGEGSSDTGGTGPRIVATLTVGDDDEPVEGATIVVRLDGAEVGEGSSGPDGSVAVELPGPGQYEVELDVDSLPDDVGLEEDAPSVLTPRVQPTGDRSVIFRLTTGGDGGAAAPSTDASGGSSTTDRLLNLLASGTRFGLVIALAAVGLSLIFGTTGLTNFAHGELLVMGAVVTWYLNSDQGGLGITLVVATLGGIAAAAAFGAWFELGVYRPLRRRGMPIVTQMVISIGLALTFRYLASIVFGSSAERYSQYSAQAPTIELGPVLLRPRDVVMSVVCVVVLVAFGVFLQRSRLGTAIRAVSDNRELSAASGIDGDRVVLIVWVLAGALGGLSGVMLGSSDFVGWNMGQRVLLIMFAAVLLGGLGTTFGAMFGGLFVGIVSDVSTYWLDADLKIVVALATLVAVLLTRPQGVFGVRARAA